MILGWSPFPTEEPELFWAQSGVLCSTGQHRRRRGPWTGQQMLADGVAEGVLRDVGAVFVECHIWISCSLQRQSVCEEVLATLCHQSLTCPPPVFLSDVLRPRTAGWPRRHRIRRLRRPRSPEVGQRQRHLVHLLRLRPVRRPGLRPRLLRHPLHALHRLRQQLRRRPLPHLLRLPPAVNALVKQGVL